MRIPVLSLLALLTLSVPLAQGQVIRGGGNPYSSQLATDPDAGTIQGIQRYGRPLATDPAQGNAYPYFVYPSVRDPSRSSPFGGSPTVPLSPIRQQQLRQQLQTMQRSRQAASTGPAKQPAAGFSASPMGPLMQMSSAATQSPAAAAAAADAMAYLNLAAPLNAPVFIPDRSIGSQRAGLGYQEEAFIRHQPLIQIKLRVVEVARSDSLNVASTLDYISTLQNNESLFNGAVPPSPNVNFDGRNVTGASRFALENLLSVNNITAVSDKNLTSNLSDGAGALINLTSKHINWITSVLAEELEADVLTAPELVTSNGESVEFVAGTKSPFNLGTVSTTAGVVNPTNDSQGLAAGRIENNVFYKHVGTYLRITPRIVNFGSYATGRGDAAITAQDVRNWNLLIRFLINENLIESTERLLQYSHAVSIDSQQGSNKRLVPLDLKSEILDQVNRFTRRDIRDFANGRINDSDGLYRLHEDLDDSTDPGFTLDFYNKEDCCPCGCGEGGCRWDPENCTIDLEVLARFSNRAIDPDEDSTSIFDTDLDDDDAADDPDLTGRNISTTITGESGVRAVANIVQVRNGTGVVMAGLLGESDVQTAAKIPILGDLPGVGFLFRAKSNTRSKSEILIFIEAKVLSQDECLARAESAEDLHLAAPYVAAETLDNPLELGLYRTGFGTYLPPPSCQEEVYWERCSRRMRRIKTTTYDALR